MRKFNQVTLLLCFLCFQTSFAQVLNGSFENWTSNSPNDWTTIDSGISLESNSSITKEGSNSAKITVTTTDQGNTDLRQTVTVTPGANYDFSVWVYHTEGGVKARLYVDGYRGYSNPALLNQWQQISFNYTPSTSSIEVGIRFYDQVSFDGSEVVYIDYYQPTITGCGNTVVTLDLLTDNYASETSWSLASGGTVLFSGSGLNNNTNYSEEFCLADGTYDFTIYDSYGDGICCAYGNGSYTVASGGTTIVSGGSFGASEVTTFTVGSSGGGFNGYYDAAAGLSGYTLKTALYNIVKGHDSQGYSAIWTFYSSHELDEYYENDGTILDIYTEKPTGTDSYNFTKSTDQCGTYSAEGGCYNREHSFPKSWFGGTVEPMNSDIHHIFATDGFVNAKRGNYPYGEVGSSTYVSSNGSKLGSGASGLGYSGTVFEPIDEFKGDLARAAFYMATRYENVISGWETNNTSGDAVLDGSSDQVFEGWALNLFIEWHNNDPVSAKEIARNEAAYTYQGNRNPFVDHPEYVGSIWGSGSFTGRIAQEATFSTHYIQEHLIVNHGEVKPVNIAIFDASGRTVLNHKNEPGQSPYTTIPVSLMNNSLYIIKVYSEDKVMSKKLVVR